MKIEKILHIAVLMIYENCNEIKLKRRLIVMRVLEGKLVDNGTRVGIVAARFNEFIVSSWLQVHRTDL